MLLCPQLSLTAPKVLMKSVRTCAHVAADALHGDVVYVRHSHILSSPPPRRVTPQQVAANAGIHAIDFRAGSVAWACDPKTHSPQVGTKSKPTSHSFSCPLLCLSLCRRGVWLATSTSLSISAALATTECCDCGTGAHQTRCRRTWLMTAGSRACLFKALHIAFIFLFLCDVLLRFVRQVLRTRHQSFSRPAHGASRTHLQLLLQYFLTACPTRYYSRPTQFENMLFPSSICSCHPHLTSYHLRSHVA